MTYVNKSNFKCSKLAISRPEESHKTLQKSSLTQLFRKHLKNYSTENSTLSA